jgi:hypothetical protein
MRRTVTAQTFHPGVSVVGKLFLVAVRIVASAALTALAGSAFRAIPLAARAVPDASNRRRSMIRVDLD